MPCRLASDLVRAVVVRAIVALFALSWAVAGDVAAVVALVLEVQICAAYNFALLAASQRKVVGLVDAANRRAQVFQFFVDAVGQFCQADDHAKHTDGADENQFSRNYEAVFIILKSVDQVHRSYSRLLIWLFGIRDLGFDI